jgi:hypothetical protein
VAAAAAVVAAAAAEACEQAVEHVAVALPAAVDTAVALGGRLRCREHRAAHRRSIVQRHVAQALGRATETCQRRAAAELAADRALATLPIGRAEHVQVWVRGLVLVRDLALERARAVVHWPTVAAARLNVICKTS